jgi:hypothetical protein
LGKEVGAMDVSDQGGVPRAWIRGEQRVTPLELFFGSIPAVALCGGIALYLLGHNAFRLRVEGSVSVPRLVVAALCLALIGVGVTVSSILTLAILALVLCGLAAFETATSRELRRELRAR